MTLFSGCHKGNDKDIIVNLRKGLISRFYAKGGDLYIVGTGILIFRREVDNEYFMGPCFPGQMIG